MSFVILGLIGSAVVTSGACGLGEATARVLAAKSLKVTLFDVSADRGAAVANDIGCSPRTAGDAGMRALHPAASFAPDPHRAAS